MGEMLDEICELNMEVVFTGDLNIDWLLHNCPLKHIVMVTTGYHY